MLTTDNDYPKLIAVYPGVRVKVKNRQHHQEFIRCHRRSVIWSMVATTGILMSVLLWLFH